MVFFSSSTTQIQFLFELMGIFSCFNRSGDKVEFVGVWWWIDCDSKFWIGFCFLFVPFVCIWVKFELHFRNKLDKFSLRRVKLKKLALLCTFRFLSWLSFHSHFNNSLNFSKILVISTARRWKYDSSNHNWPPRQSFRRSCSSQRAGAKSWRSKRRSIRNGLLIINWIKLSNTSPHASI